MKTSIKASIKNLNQRPRLFHRVAPWGLLLALLGSGCSLTLPATLSSSEPIATTRTQTATTQTASEPAACDHTPTPLTAKEQTYAQVAWQYFQNNRQPDTGLVNAADRYPSGTLWDQGNYLTALNAARWLDLIDQSEFDQQLTAFLTGLDALPLFEGTLPNKVYNSASGQIVDYNNQPIEQGLGWSALDIGRMLAAMHIVRSCHPHHAPAIEAVVEDWNLAASVKDGSLYGATLDEDGNTLAVQEGRLGYEEYAARGYGLWGYDLPVAIALEPMTTVTIEGIEIPADSRDYDSSNGSNYVVSESYILEGIEFGLPEPLKDHAKQLLAAQEARYERTGELTAVSEDNIDQPPHFLYSTVHANGEDWAVITADNEAHPELRTLSTKSAFGWHYLFPENAYAQQLFDAVKDLQDPDKRGFYAGLYEVSDQPNAILTGNTNGLILEILYYKARGNQPLLAPSKNR